MPSYYYTKFQKNPCVGRNERCPFSSPVIKTFKFSLRLCIRENTDVFITLDENIYGIHSKRVNLYLNYGNVHCKP